MNRGVDRQDVFHDDVDRIVFERLLGETSQAHDIEIHAYCLMGNHFHLLLHCPNAGLSAQMQQLLSSYTRIVNDRLGRDGPLFRGRFHSVPVTADRQLMATTAYIHRNPAEFVPLAAIAAYRWSSFGVYMGRRPAPPWLRQDTISSLLRTEDHRSLVLADDSYERADGRAVSMRLIDALVARRFPSGGPSRRSARLLLGTDVAGFSISEIARHFDMSPGTARTALCRARQLMERDPEFAALVTEISATLAAGA
jgi:REP element-mobilizing transposase RayT